VSFIREARNEAKEIVSEYCNLMENIDKAIDPFEKKDLITLKDDV
jgi:hypothetical protein